MALTHTNRKGVEYRVRVTKTKTVRDRYTCTTKPEGPFAGEQARTQKEHFRKKRQM
jgi:hypothetical protein